MTEPTDFTPYDPAGLPVPTEPPRLPAPGHLVGRADGMQLRTESDPYVRDSLVTVLGFRLWVPDRPQPLEVELRGPSLSGGVRDGDWVEVADRPGAGGLYSAKTVTNLTTGVPVTVEGQPGPVAKTLGLVFVVVFVLLFLVVLGIIVFGFLDVSSGFSGWSEPAPFDE